MVNEINAALFMVWVKFIKHFWKSKVSFYNLELLPFSSSLLLLSEQICCEPLIWSWLAWGYLVFCVALNEYNKDKKKWCFECFFLCLFVFSAPRTVTVSSQMESRWSGYFYQLLHTCWQSWHFTALWDNCTASMG